MNHGRNSSGRRAGLLVLLQGFVVPSALVIVPLGTQRFSTTSPPGADSVDFVPLPMRSPMQRDCPAEPSTVALCRVRRAVDAAMLRAALARGLNVHREGDELTFAYAGPGERVMLSGGLQYPLSRVVGTDLWVLTLRLAEIDRVILSYSIVPDIPGRGERLRAQEWRGPSAPVRGPRAAALQGSIRVDTMATRVLSRPRGVIVYRPPAHGTDPVAGVIYLGDGGAVHGIAPYLDTLIVSGHLPRVMLVGIPSAMPGPGDPTDRDVRAMEYLWDFEPGNQRFLAHERFVLDEVIPWAEARYGAPRVREERAVWGMSNSAAWAIRMGLRHPETFGIVLAASPGGVQSDAGAGARLVPPTRFLIQAGVLEPAFHRIALAWRDSLRARSLDCTLREVAAGHDWLYWSERFPDLVRWGWKRSSDVAR